MAINIPKDQPPTKVESKPIEWGPYLRQILCGSLVCMGQFTSGSTLAFPSVIVSSLEANKRNLYGQFFELSKTEQDLLGSVTALAGVLGVLLSAKFVNLVGRRRTLSILAAVMFISWIGVALSPSAIVMLVFRFLGGLAYGGFSMVALAYIIELTDDELRGPLALLTAGNIVTGQLVGVLPAYWLPYYHVAFVNSSVPALFFLATIFIIPDSPTALTLEGREDKAKEILTKLRRSSVYLDKEIQSFKDMNALFKDVNVVDSFKNKTILTNLGLVCGIFFVQVFAGYINFVAQTARILKDSGSTMNEHTAIILVEVAQLMGVIAAMFLVKYIGRRGILLVSHAVMGVFILAFATFTYLYADKAYLNNESLLNHGEFHLENFTEFYKSPPVSVVLPYTNTTEYYQYNTTSTLHVLALQSKYPIDASYMEWVPVVLLMAGMFGCCLGTENVPFVLASEYFPTAVRPYAASLCICWSSVLGFVSLQIYTPLQGLITQAGILYMHAAISLCALPYTFFLLKETAGKQVG